MGDGRGLSRRVQGSRVGGGGSSCVWSPVYVYSRELQVCLGEAVSNVSGNPRYIQREGTRVNIREVLGVSSCVCGNSRCVVGVKGSR